MKASRAADPLSQLQMHKAARVQRDRGTAEFALHGTRVSVFAYPPGTEVPSRILSRPTPRTTQDLLELADEALRPRRG